MARKRIGEILVEAGALSPSGLRAALGEQKRWGGFIGRILVSMQLITEDALVKALSRQLNFPIVELDKFLPPPQVLQLIPGDLAEQLEIIPFNVEGKFLDLAMSNPTNLGIIDELRIRTRLTVRPHLAGPTAIERALAKHYRRGPALHARAPLALESAEPQPIDSSPPSSFDRRAQEGVPPGLARGLNERDAEIRALQERISSLEALVARDEDVLRKLLGLLVEKGVTTREEILERIR